jgi:hypothetical protein
LFEGVLGDVLPTLAPPRRHALEVALLVEEAHDDPVDHRALAVAVRDVLDVLSDHEPVVVAVDDVQWLDPSSARALAFALRRLGEKNVRVLLARRLGSQASELECSAEARCDRAAQRRRRPPAAQRPAWPIVRTPDTIRSRTVGWNPFFALEIAGALDGDVDPLEPLLPRTLEGWFACA